jgi:acetyltransferase-like isoleucine patch superfamily enzyme
VIKSLTEYSAWCINARGFSFVGEASYIRSPARIHNPRFMTIGNSVTAEPGLVIEAYSAFAGDSFDPRITIGDRVSFGYHCHVGCINEVTIGNNVLIASRVFISDHSHGGVHGEDLDLPPARRRLFSKGAIRIGCNVWIGEGVSILPGVTIGNNSIVGANSVVTHDVPDDSVFAGVPARLIKQFARRDSAA